MPELPEVETIARRLQEVIRGKHISQVKILRPKSFHGDPSQIVGTAIEKISRKAKVLRFHLSNGLSLLIHLKMTGQLIYVDDDKRVGGGHPSEDWVHTLPSKHTRVIIEFGEGGMLFFNDLRVFGWIKVASQEEVAQELSPYGPDIIDKVVTVEYVWQWFQRRSQAIKIVIMDSAIVAGVGNIYANDALHLAKVAPIRPANSLTKSEVKTVLEAMKTVIQKGIELGGATIDNYRTVDGLAGGYQDVVRVYQREGQPCLVCGTEIKRIKQSGRSTFYCQVCQV